MADIDGEAYQTRAQQKHSRLYAEETRALRDHMAVASKGPSAIPEKAPHDAGRVADRLRAGRAVGYTVQDP